MVKYEFADKVQSADCLRLKKYEKFLDPSRESNPGPLEYEVSALPTELLLANFEGAKNYSL